MERTHPRIEPIWTRLFTTRFRLSVSEAPVFASLDAYETPYIGRIDYIAYHQGQKWLVEEDMDGEDKWHWCKLVAYKAAFLLDNPQIRPSQIRLLAVLTSEIYTPALRRLLETLDIDYIFLSWRGRSEVTVMQTSIPQVLISQRISLTEGHHDQR